MNETFQNEEMARRILQNQRTILEQNSKILANQDAIKATQESNTVNSQRQVVPAIFKVKLNHYTRITQLAF